MKRHRIDVRVDPSAGKRFITRCIEGWLPLMFPYENFSWSRSRSSGERASRSMARARALASLTGKTRPETSSVTSSSGPGEASLTIAARPQLMASISAFGEPSWIDGRTKMLAAS